MPQSSPKILIIDDDPSIRNLYKAKLTREGYGVLLAKEGSEGFVLAKQESPDLIMLDLLMPGVDGPMFLKILGEEKKTKDIPVLVLTNKGEFKEEIESYGIAEYLVKANTTPKKVLEKIESLLPESARPAVKLRQERKVARPVRKDEPKEKAVGKSVKIPRERVLKRPAEPLTEQEMIEATLFELRQKGRVGVKETLSEQKRIFKKNYKILLVEDDPIISRLYRTKLELEDQTVTYAATGQAALDAMKAQRPDFIMLDIQMPDMTGIDVLEEMKKTGLSTISVMVLTNSEDENTRRKSFELGAKEYMNKAEVTPTAVLKRINEILTTPREKPEE